MPAPTFSGPERTLSSDLGLPTASLQSITALANGSFITTISTPGTNGSGYAFTHYGDGRWKSYVTLNAAGGTSESNWTASALKDGGFVLSWDNDIPGTPWEEYVHAGIRNVDGSARAASFQVNDVDTKSDRNGAITTLENGNFAVLYTNEDTDDGQNDLFVKFFTSNGTALGDGVRVGSKVASDQESPSATGLKSGELVIVYEDDSFSPDHPGSTTVRGAIITADGETREFHVPEGLTGHQGDPQVAALVDGRFVVTWTNWANLSDASVHARIYNADGTADSDVLQVNTTDVWNQHESSVTALRNGGFAVAFTHNGLSELDNGDILVQFFTASGEKDGDEVQVNTTTRGDQTKPVISELADGRVVVGWHDQALKDNPTNIRYQVLDPRTDGITQTGTANADDFVGTAFGDVFDGGVGNDTLDGGAGADTVIFSGARTDYAVTKEASGALRLTNARTGEIDTVSNVENFTFAGVAFSLAEVLASVVTAPTSDPTTFTTATSFALPSWALNLIATGKAGIALTGNALGNTLKGNAGKNVLKGLAGNDKLWGGLGSDTLTGGTGKDVFVFSTKPNKKTNLDKIADFSVKDDTIFLDNAIFKKLGKGTEARPGKLNKGFFTIGDKARDGNDFLIYNSKTGVLSYDGDGSGAGVAVEIALLRKGLKMTAADFMVI